MKYKIVVLDLSTSEVHVFNYSGKTDTESLEEFVFSQHSEQGNTFKESNCDWMFVDMEQCEGRIPIYFH